MICKLSLMILLCLQVALGNDNDLIHCPLKWVTASYGEPLPAKSIPTALNEGTNYIARYVADDQYFAGRAKNSSRAYIPHNQGVLLDSYEILTNPHGCVTKWVRYLPNMLGNFPVPTETGYNKYLGRAYVNGVLLSGEIAQNRIRILTAENTIVSLTQFEILRSYSNGLNLEMTDFTLIGDLQNAKDFVGTDEICNLANSYVTQIVSFKRRVFQSTTTTCKSSSSHTFTADLKIGIPEMPGSGINVGYEFGKKDSKSTEIKHETEEIVEVIREVTVPPFTSVQVCSTISILDNFSVNYVSRGRYSAPGLSGAEVETILANSGVRGFIHQDSVITEETGSFAGSLGLNTQFIVVPLDAPEGCSELSKKIQEAKKLRQRVGNSAKLTEMNLEINNMMKRMGKALYN